MPIKPTGFPEWASATPTGITEPTDAKKKSGWLVSEKPPAQYMNWLAEKQSSWIRYLSYDWIISDDFIRNTKLQGVVGPSGSVPTGVYPTWDGADITKFFGFALAHGVVQHDLQASMTRNFWCSDSIIPNGQDCIFESIIAQRSRGGSGSAFLVGAISSPTFGASGALWFSSTGPSSSWFFNYFPPGGGITSVNMNVDPLVGGNSGYQRLLFEKRGSTAVAEISGNVVTVPVASQLSEVLIGLQMFNTTGTASIVTDSIKFGVRRS